MIERKVEKGGGKGKASKEGTTQQANVPQQQEKVRKDVPDWLVDSTPAFNAANLKEALILLLKQINGSKSPSSRHYRELLAAVESHGREYYADLPLVVGQMNSEGRMSAATLQVQLCEFRQFETAVAREESKKESNAAASRV